MWTENACSLMWNNSIDRLKHDLFSKEEIIAKLTLLNVPLKIIDRKLKETSPVYSEECFQI